MRATKVNLHCYVYDVICNLQSHTILLVQPTKRPEGRTYADYESVNECMEGIFKINHDTSLVTVLVVIYGKCRYIHYWQGITLGFDIVHVCANITADII